MALEFAKKQLFYAIHRCMVGHGVDECVFHYDKKKKPSFTNEGIIYEIHWVDEPDMFKMELPITTIPSYSCMLDAKIYKPSDFHYLRTLEHIFEVVYDKLAEEDKEGLYPKEERDKWLNKWVDEFAEVTE